jgi:hypothetical protein
VRDELIGSLDLVFRDRFWNQKIEYCKIVFHSHGCHGIGHI